MSRPASLTALARFSLAAVLLAYGEIMLGSWTRIQGAGMTCPDYPLCHGEFIPSMGGGTVWEWTHRLIAAVLSLLVIGVLVLAWRNRNTAGFVKPLGGLTAFLFGFQVFLGAATVHLDNSPISVVWHWGTAMLFTGTLSAMAIFAFAHRAAIIRAPFSRRRSLLTGVLAAAAALIFTTMCLGAYVSSSGAGLACLQVPQCAGNVVVYTPGQAVQMLHRFIAASTVLMSLGAVALTWILGAGKRVRIAAACGLALLFVQVLLGLLNVVLRLPIDLREAHAANAALVFLMFVSATTFCALDGWRVAARAPA